MTKQIIDGFLGRDYVFAGTGLPNPSSNKQSLSVFSKTSTKNLEASGAPDIEPGELDAAPPSNTEALSSDGAEFDESTENPSPDDQPNEEEKEVLEELSQNQEVEQVSNVVASKKDSKVAGFKSKSNPKPKKFKLKHPKIMIALTLFSLLIILASGSFLYFHDKALPGSHVLGSSVAGMTSQELADFISQKETDFRPVIISDKKLLTPELGEIGLSYDTNQTIDEVMSIHRGGSLFDKLAWWQTSDVSLSVDIDRIELAKYLKVNVKSAIAEPVNAKLAFDGGSQKFQITPDKAGKGIDVDQAAGALVDSARITKPLSLEVSTTPIPAKLQATDLVEVQTSAQTYVDNSLRLVSGGTVFVPTTHQKASWLKLSPDLKQRTYTISIDDKAVQSYVNSSLATLTKEMQPKLTIDTNKDKPGGILQGGQDGQVVTNTTQLASAMSKAFNDKKPYEGRVDLKVQKASTKSMKAYPKWIYVSLSQQRLTAYEYAKPVKSFLISSGKAGYETEIGVFKVWHKVPVQTMKGGSMASGDYYDLPNVHWDTYFNGEVAIHEAYWHNNFGHPMSHGCLNATYADAKWIFDWAPHGTTVVVQN